MRGEWGYFGKWFDPDRCERIIQNTADIPFAEAKLGTEGISDNLTRKSNIKFIQSDNVKFDYLFQEIWKMGRIVNDDFFNFHLSRLNFLQLAEYSDEYRGEYKAHHDVFWMNDDPKYHRKMTCVIQLSDPTTYEGGDLEIYNTRHEIDINNRRSQGTAIFFPSFYTHAVTPVTQGKRYSLTAWFEGPKWR